MLAFRSSFGDEATRRGLKVLVDAFHCWAHKRDCQCQFHPLYRPRFGLEDFSTNERLYSMLNACARLTWHMSNYRWKQTIDLQVRQINEERYASSGASLLSYARLQSNSIRSDFYIQ